MSAETLRRTAALMRERAEAAGAAPWFADEAPAELPGSTHTYVRFSVWGTDSWGKGNTPYIAEANGRTGAEHMASWHPAVALAVADWLEYVCDAKADSLMPSDQAAIRHALEIARAYLGTRNPTEETS